MLGDSNNTHCTNKQSIQDKSQYSHDPSNKSSSCKLAKSGRQQSMGEGKVQSMEDEIEDTYDMGELNFSNNPHINRSHKKIYQTEAEKVPPTKKIQDKISTTHKVEKHHKPNV